ncbi:protein-L-isoaspartate O-methyltransferase family protein [Sphingomonas xanthus]|uniref:Protein-L-isoaspartate O-methyltransferase n=1 Tax=Sphingomonas xanthus TaxID=2594473 RepID=A0A516IT05_9SPHN|nr:protein-L-isoaspartate O-methyltransferase [Sphingomonas xanthus]QDP20006.1 protein-L-isoaspartate O-methyltransferase [Sphingomonas xanthus]
MNEDPMQDFAIARRMMVDSQLRPLGVTDRNVLAAMARVERERFVPEEARAFAYFDRPLKTGNGRAMMPPAALGRLLSEAAPRPGQRALVVGSGTGYSAAILETIGLDVTSLESDADLAAIAAAANIESRSGELTKGWPKGAPYDLILIDGAVADVPDALVKQLADNGVLACAIVDRGVTRLVVGRCAAGRLGMRTIVDADAAVLPGFERPPVFIF